MQRELVERARSGDLEAFSDLARGSLTRLYAVATLILRDQHRAEDAVQEALLHAWKSMAALRDPDAFDAWLRRITVRACYQAAKKQKRRVTVELQEAADERIAGDPGPQQWVGDRDELWEAIGELPVDQRAVIVVHYYLDLPLSKAAEILDIPVGTAKSRLHYGLRALRRSVDDTTAAAAPQTGEGAA